MQYVDGKPVLGTVPGVGIPKGGKDGQLLAKDGDKDYHTKWVNPPSGGDFDIKEFLLAAHPVGSYYWSSDSTNPSELFGGTWEQIKDRFVLAAGDTYEAEASGGAATVTLTTEQIPAHTHNSIQLTGAFSLRTMGSSGATISISSSGIVNRNNITVNEFSKISQESKTDTTIQQVEINASHEHTKVGNGKSHENMPPYITAYCWKRIA